MGMTRPTPQLHGRRALVTGGGRGIGLAIAARLVDGGATVAIADIDGDGAAAAAAKLGNGSVAIECDVRDDDQVVAAVASAAEQLGGLDTLVNNAGIEIAKPLTELTSEEFTRILDINVVGTFRCTQAAIGALAESGNGAIVNLASVAGVGGAPLLAAYCASKGAVVRFTEAAAVELRAANIRVNAVCPGLVATEMAGRLVDPLEAVAPVSFDEIVAMKQGRLGEPDEVAEMVAFLASDDSSFINGAHYLLDGGMTAGLL